MSLWGQETLPRTKDTYFPLVPALFVRAYPPFAQIPFRLFFVALRSLSVVQLVIHLRTAKLAVPLRTESGEGKAANRNPRRSSAVNRACTGNGVPAVGRRFGAEFSDWRWAGDEGRSL